MSRLRHERKHRMAGGMTSKPQWNAGGSQNAAKEAEELKKGGRAKHHGEGEHAKKRHDRPKRERGGVVQRAKGGGVHHAAHSPEGKHHDGGTHHDGMHVDGTGGEKTHKRAHGGALNKPVHEGHPHHMLHPHKRARGGRLRGEGMGAERTPLTSAAKIREVTPGELPPHGVRSD
jgi:hypothetical protein